MNPYIEIKNTFQFLECMTRQKEAFTRCRSLPANLSGRNPEAALRDYVFCLMLVRVIAQLEFDIDIIDNVPGLKQTDKLAPRHRILRNHFQIGREVFEAVDQIRDARNQFVHDGVTTVNPGCTKAEMPGHIITFLQRCNQPSYR